MYNQVKQTKINLQKYIHPFSLTNWYMHIVHVQCKVTKKGQQKVPILKNTSGLCPFRSYYYEVQCLKFAGKEYYGKLHQQQVMFRWALSATNKYCSTVSSSSKNKKIMSLESSFSDMVLLTLKPLLSDKDCSKCLWAFCAFTRRVLTALPEAMVLLRQITRLICKGGSDSAPSGYDAITPEQSPPERGRFNSAPSGHDAVTPEQLPP